MSEGLVLTSVDGPAHKPTCGHVAGNHHLLPAPPTTRAAICCHPAASDARPPSDTEATGWAIDPSGNIHRQGGGCYSTHCRPVIVVDPAEARETIARALMRHAWDSNPNTAHGRHRFHAFCEICAGNVVAITDLGLAALAGQEQP